MTKQEEIKEGMKKILTEDFINCGITHENPPPGKDCGEECGVSLYSQIAAVNPIFAPIRSGRKKHKKCMSCWNEYIDSLILRLTAKQSSQGCVIKVVGELPSIFDSNENVISALEYKKKLAGYVAVEPLIEEK